MMNHESFGISIEALVMKLEKGLRTQEVASIAFDAELSHALERCQLLGLVCVHDDIEFTKKGTIYLLSAKAKQLRKERGVA